MNSEFRTQDATPETRNLKNRTLAAFTLIELLVVIAVIAVLAGLLFTAMPAVTASRMRSVARAELTQISTAIEGYKAKYGFYPPDNRAPNGTATPNPLYYELIGAQIVGNNYNSLDGGASILTNRVVGPGSAFIYISGIVNSGYTIAATDERPAITSFLKDLKPTQWVTNTLGVRFLAFSGDGTQWSYNSSQPTNNTGSYDLWFDLVLGNKTNRISNWGR